MNMMDQQEITLRTKPNRFHTIMQKLRDENLISFKGRRKNEPRKTAGMMFASQNKRASSSKIPTNLNTCFFYSHDKVHYIKNATSIKQKDGVLMVSPSKIEELDKQNLSGFSGNFLIFNRFYPQLTSLRLNNHTPPSWAPFSIPQALIPTTTSSCLPRKCFIEGNLWNTTTSMR